MVMMGNTQRSSNPYGIAPAGVPAGGFGQPVGGTGTGPGPAAPPGFKLPGEGFGGPAFDPGSPMEWADASMSLEEQAELRKRNQARADAAAAARAGGGGSMPPGAPSMLPPPGPISGDEHARRGGGGGEGGPLTGPGASQEQQRRAMESRQSQAAEAGGTALGSLVSEYNKAYGSARSANEARYQEMLGIADKTTGQRSADIRRDYGEQSAGEGQRLARLGMSNTTVLPTMQMGYEREKQSALNRLADQMQGTRLGIMERRQDPYPDSSMITGLAQQLGQNPMSSGQQYTALSKYRLA